MHISSQIGSDCISWPSKPGGESYTLWKGTDTVYMTLAATPGDDCYQVQHSDWCDLCSILWSIVPLPQAAPPLAALKAARKPDAPRAGSTRTRWKRQVSVPHLMVDPDRRTGRLTCLCAGVDGHILEAPRGFMVVNSRPLLICRTPGQFFL